MSKNHPFDLRRWQHWIALGFGAGLSAKAPGTVGTLVALPFVLVVWPWGDAWAAGFVLLCTVLGFYVCEKVSKDIGIADHGSIVWDEVTGFAIALWAIPLTWTNILLAFLLFRLLDILKPWPINWCDRHMKGGVGVMLDDIVAGAITCVLLHSLWLPLHN